MYFPTTLAILVANVLDPNFTAGIITFLVYFLDNSIPNYPILDNNDLIISNNYPITSLFTLVLIDNL